MNIGKRIKVLREKNNYTLDQLSEISLIAKPTLSKYENNHNEPNAANLIKLADVFNVSVDYLLGRDIHVSSEDDEEYKIVISKEELQVINALRMSEIKNLNKFILDDPKRRLLLLNNNKYVINLINMTE